MDIAVDTREPQPTTNATLSWPTGLSITLSGAPWIPISLDDAPVALPGACDGIFSLAPQVAL